MAGDKDWLFKLKENTTALICAATLAILSLTAIFAFLIIPDNSKDANRQIVQLALQPPGTIQNVLVISKKEQPSKMSLFDQIFHGQDNVAEYLPIDSFTISNQTLETHFQNMTSLRDHVDESQIRISEKYFLLGTDKYGRDVLSRIILGLRISLVIGFLAVAVSLLLGVVLGSAAGYFGGWTDRVIMLFINTGWSIPTLLMAFAIIIALGKGFFVIVLAVGLTMWVDVARVVRGQTMQLKTERFIQASKVIGINDLHIIFKHILPNILGTILVISAANFATAILVEAGLSYLGLGIQPPTPSLGNMLQEGYAYATGGFVYLAFFPILTIMILVLSFNMLGTALRDAFDIKTIQK